MKIANVKGRATLVVDGGGIDVERGSGGRLPADPQALFERWPALLEWAAGASAGAPVPIRDADLGPPAPRPTQVFGIGLNYRAHAAESGLPTPDKPATFTKFPTCITGTTAVELPSGMVDWEVELVVVIGARAYHVAEADGWNHVAGVTVGQDLSERAVQWAHGKQFSLGKSFPGFGPTGPWLVTPEELPSRDDLALRCTVSGETMQDARSSDMVFGVAQLVAELSAILPLLPGDVIFTGTPAGVGASRKPPRFLRPGDVIESWIEGIGTLRTSLVAPAAR